MGIKLKRLFWVWVQSLKSMKKVKTFVPFAIYAILQFLILFMLTNFTQMPFAKILIPIIKKMFGEPALHYPNFFMVLSTIYNQINIIMSGLIGILIIGIATHLFSANYQNENLNIGTATKFTLSKYGTLIAIWFVEMVLSLLMIIGVPQLMNKFLQPEYMVTRFIELGGFLLGVLVASIFAYSTMVVIIEGGKFVRAIIKTIMIFKSNAITTFLLVAIPTFIYYPINLLLRKSGLLISKFSPEIIVFLLGFGVIVMFFTNYIQIGSLTRFYLLQNERSNY